MKITKLQEYLKEKGFHHTKNSHLTEETKVLIYQSRREKSKTMSKRQFWSYLQKFWIWWSSLRNVVKRWEDIEKTWVNVLIPETRDNTRVKEYTIRYKETERNKKIDNLSNEAKEYIVNFRLSNPNAWYKRFYNKHLQPKYLEAYSEIFGGKEIIGKTIYYAILDEAEVNKRMTKREKQTYIQERYRKHGGIKAYCNKMKYVYMRERALHRWQVDIKYLIDIPNMLQSEIAFICPYQITFRDFKSWAVLKFFWKNRDTSRVMVATQIFETIMRQAGIDVKQIFLQFDGWAEFSTLKINGAEWKYFEYIKGTFKGYWVIDRKEHNGHVEAYHRICEEDFMDTADAVIGMKWKTKDEKKEMFIARAHEYVKNHNKYWFSSYRPRYETFWKKNPLQIIKEDRSEKINDYILETYLGAYDVDWWIRMPRKNTYKTLINAIINNKILEANHPYNVCPTEDKKSGQVWARLYTNWRYWFYLYNNPQRSKIINFQSVNS